MIDGTLACMLSIISLIGGLVIGFLYGNERD